MAILMHTKLKALGIIAAVAFTLIRAQPLSATQPTQEDSIINLLPTGHPPFTDEELHRYNKLRKMGAEAHTALSKELLSTNDEYRIGLIVGLMVEGEGDKKIALDAVRKLGDRRLGDTEKDIKVRLTVILALGKIGTAEDLGYLENELNAPLDAIQINSVRSMALIGDDKAIPLIERWANKNKHRLPNAITELEKARDVIRKRAGEKSDKGGGIRE